MNRKTLLIAKKKKQSEHQASSLTRDLSHDRPVRAVQSKLVIPQSR
jgi:hypothetical protein